MNKLKAWNAPPVTPPPPPPEVALLTEIRDLLKQDKKP
jgi:large-conductance mechanosensitive channel